MAFLVSNSGPDRGQRYELTQDRYVIGRHADCDIVVDIRTVSRQHAQIVLQGRDYYLEDMQSRNGTFINGQALAPPQKHRLEHGDTVRICDTAFEYRTSEADDDSPLATLLIDDDDVASSISQAVMSETRVDSLPKEQFYELIANKLQRNHVHSPDIDSAELEADLSNPDSIAHECLHRGFYRIVVINARMGLGENAEFELLKFLQYVFRQMATAFDIRLSGDGFHAELISQYLKDEPRSLFCFLNFDLIPTATIRRLRGFTQEGHQCLFCGDHPLDGVKKETVRRLEPRMSRAEAKFAALVEIGQSLHGELSLDDVLPKVLDSLFEIFMQADRGLVVLKDPSTGRLVPKAVKHRQMDVQDTIRMSRTIIGRVMSSKEAILSADAATDSRFDMAQSIADFQICSMMCAPLIGSDGEAVGVIQIDTLDQRSRFSPEDLDVLASVACETAVCVENAQLHEIALQEREMAREMAVAHEMQQGFLPAGPPQVAQYAFFDFYKPARQLGGDYFDYIPLPAGRLAVVLADVSGKGVAAALLVARLSAETRYCLAAEPAPTAAVARLNNVFCEDRWEDRFVTLVLCVIDPAAHEVTVVNAGHMPPIHRREDGSLEQPDESISGMPLGVIDDFEYEVRQVALSPGESIVLYTDGISECQNAEGAMYGIDRLRAQITAGRSGTPTSLGKFIIKDINDHSADVPQSDDMCLVIFGRQ